MRIFIGTAEIAGYYARLDAGFRAHGVTPSLVQFTEHPFAYEVADDRGPLHAFVGWTARQRFRAAQRSRLQELVWRTAQLPLRVVVLVWSLIRCDGYIFVYGTSIAGRWELPLLRLFGRPVVHVFHGSDSRPAYLDGFLVQGGDDPRRLRRLTRRTARHLRWIERWSTTIMAHPPSAQLHRRPFVAGLHVGIPITSAAPVGRQRDHPSVRPIRLLHSPSNPELKGTATIREIISDLQRTGMPLELVEIHGRPNAEVRAAILECDLVVDQMYSDQPLAGFATEAAAEGVGIVTSGYAAGDPGALIQHELPVLYVQPQAMAEAIAGLAQDEAARVELGRRSRVFVESHWQPGQVAERFLLMLRGEAPPEWLVDPADITYPLGCGLPESRVARLIHGLVERYGPSALGVDDKPELLARLLAVASTVTESVRTVSESPPDSTNKIGA